MEPERRLAHALAHERVSAAWLFGSRASGTASPLSDVDVGVLPDAEMSAEERFALVGRVASAAEAAFRVPHADVVLVDEASPHIAFAAIRGRLLVNRHDERRWLAEARIMSTYHDRRHADERWLSWTKERYGRGDFA